MGMASFEVLKESFASLLYRTSPLAGELSLASFYNMLAVVAAKLLLLRLCRRAARRRVVVRTGRSVEGGGGSSSSRGDDFDDEEDDGDDDDEEEEDEEEDGLAGGEAAIGYEYDDASSSVADTTLLSTESPAPLLPPFRGGTEGLGAALVEGAGAPAAAARPAPAPSSSAARAVVQLADPTLEAVAQDHFNDILSNAVAAVALLLALRDPRLWYLDPVGAVLISLYIIYSWYQTGREQIEHLTGRSAPADFIDELKELAHNFDDRMQVDTVRAYHFGPKFLVEIEVVMPKTTLLFESHDVGMELQYEIEGRQEVERCFVHIDYQSRPYDEHVVSKVPELREKYRPRKQRSTLSL
jgi:divalent metal cation (Fe/Co/Zn/Cd) transporter